MAWQVSFKPNSGKLHEIAKVSPDVLEGENN